VNCTCTVTDTLGQLSCHIHTNFYFVGRANRNGRLGFEIFTAMAWKSQVFGDMPPCKLVVTEVSGEHSSPIVILAQEE